MELSSIKHSPIETLITLRKRFSKLLSESENYYKPSCAVELSDIDLLEVLSACEVTIGREESIARSNYASIMRAHNFELSFNEILEKGWIKLSLGRVYCIIPRDALRYESVDSKRAEVLRSFRSSLYRVKFEIPLDIAQRFPNVADHMAERTEGINIGSPSPHWVAARLWDECVKNHASDVIWWVDRIQHLALDKFVPEDYWSESRSDEFMAATLSLLERTDSSLTWVSAEVLAHKSSLISKRDDSGGFTSQLPTSIIEKFEWLHNSENEAFLFESLYQSSDLYLPIRIILNHVISGHLGNSKKDLAHRLIDIAYERPEILEILVNATKRNPLLVADLVMSTKLSAFACFLVVRWGLEGSAWDRDVLEAIALEDKATAFSDALDVLTFFINKGDITPEDFSSLFIVIRNEESSFGFGKKNYRGKNGRILRHMLCTLARLNEQFLLSVVEVYGRSPARFLVGDATFSCALDIISRGNLIDKIEPNLIAESYIRSLDAPPYYIGVAGIDMESAAALVQIGLRAENKLRLKFLAPYDVVRSFSKAAKNTRESYSIFDKLCLVMRAHIRILCRASSYLGVNTPQDVIASLISTINSGAFDDKVNNRVCAFTSRYENSGLRGRGDIPISHDLAVALRALSKDGENALMETILLINEPLVLAQLFIEVSEKHKPQLEARIKVLTPENSPSVWAIDESDARIAALLETGIASAAEAFIEDSKDFRTMGRLSDRELKNLHRDLSLAFLKKRWPDIRGPWPVEGLSAENKRHADEIILFFRGLVELKADDGDPGRAVRIFEELSNRKNKNTAYKVNLIASKVWHILGGDAFAILPPERYKDAGPLLNDINSLLEEIPDRREKEILSINKAILLLSIGRNHDAFQILASIPLKDGDSSALAYSAIALFRMGQGERAHAILTHQRFEDHPESIVAAALEHIDGGGQSKGPVIFQTDANDIRASRNAFNTLLGMSATDQIKVVKGNIERVAYIIETVRLAARALVSLVPMTNFISISDCEDDLNAFLDKIIESRVSFLGWSTSDQSRGGYSAKGNPGERDIVIKRHGVELSIIEALICDKPVTNQSTINNLESHFQKLFGYGECWMPIHLTYSFHQDGVRPILDFLQRMCAEGLPDGIKYKNQISIEQNKALPQGFVANYERDGVEIPMLFLVLDLGQGAQKAASKKAGSTKSRKTDRNQVKK